MRWLSVSSNAAGLKEQCEEVWEAVRSIKEPPDLGLIFPVCAGCCAELGASSQQELFQRKGVVVLLGWLPGVIVENHVLTDPNQLPSDDEGPDAWHRILGPPPLLQILFSVSNNDLPAAVFTGLDSAYPHTVRTGLCGDDRYVFSGGERVREGLLVLSLRGAIKVVTHGSDPWIKLGSAGVVTSLTESGRIATIDGRSASDYLKAQIFDPTMLQLYRYYELYLGIGMGFELNPTSYEKGHWAKWTRKQVVSG